MIFNELSYFLLFLLPAVAAFHLGPRHLRAWAIIFFGCAFFVYYGYLHFGGRWGALCVLIFVWETLTSRLYRPGSRWCLFGIAQALLLLLAFKYLTFAVSTWNDLSALLGLKPLATVPRILLPLGISFFTFEFVHFAADTYRGKIEKTSLSEYGAFILFFPSMVAGPIKRFQDFRHKMRDARFDTTLASQGITRILAGLVKKHLLADTFALWAARLNGPALYAAHWYQIVGWIFAYGMQIYLDFSAYSDIAIGSGYLFGIVIPENVASYRLAVTATPEAAEYQRWLAEQLAHRGGSLLDLSAASWVDDRLFIDELHLGPEGAVLVSREIAKHLAATLQ